MSDILQVGLARYLEKFGEQEREWKDDFVTTENHVLIAVKRPHRGRVIFFRIAPLRKAKEQEKKMAVYIDILGEIREYNAYAILAKNPYIYAGEIYYGVEMGENIKAYADYKRVLQICQTCGGDIETEIISDRSYLAFNGKRYNGIGHCSSCKNIVLVDDDYDIRDTHRRVTGHHRDGNAVKGYWRKRPVKARCTKKEGD